MGHHAVTLSKNIGGISITDGKQVAKIDLSTGAFIVTDYSHHEIHNGESFEFTMAVTLGSGASQDVIVQTPNTAEYAHMLGVIDATTTAQFRLYEGCTKTSLTLSSGWNRNRNNAATASTVIWIGADPGSGDDGTLIRDYSSGTSSNQSKSSSGVRDVHERILKRNTKYLYRAISGAAGNLINFDLNWYQHTNEDGIVLH